LLFHFVGGKNPCRNDVDKMLSGLIKSLKR